MRKCVHKFHLSSFKSTIHYRPLPLPPPRGPRERPEPLEGPRPRPPPRGGGGFLARGEGERRRRSLPGNGGRPRGTGGGPRDAPRPVPTLLANLIFPRLLLRWTGAGRPRPLETRDIISLSSGEEERDRSTSREPGLPAFPCDRGAGPGRPVRRGPSAVLRFVIISGSRPFKVKDDVLSFRYGSGQSPTRCFALAQLAQEMETEIWSECRSRDGNFQRKSHSDSRCSWPHMSQGTSEAEHRSLDVHCGSPWPLSRHFWHLRQVGQTTLACLFHAPQCEH